MDRYLEGLQTRLEMRQLNIGRVETTYVKRMRHFLIEVLLLFFKISLAPREYNQLLIKTFS